MSQEFDRKMRGVPDRFAQPVHQEDVWSLLDPSGVSVLPPSGAYGVRKLTTTIASIADIPNLASPGVLPSGIGIVQNQRTAALAILLNDTRSRIRRDIYVGEVFSVTSFSVLITGSSPAAYMSVMAPTVIRG